MGTVQKETVPGEIEPAISEAKTQSFATALQRTYDSNVFNFVMVYRIVIVPSHLTFLQIFSMKMRSTPYGVKIKNDQ